MAASGTLRARIAERTKTLNHVPRLLAEHEESLRGQPDAERQFWIARREAADAAKAEAGIDVPDEVLTRIAKPKGSPHASDD